MRPSIRVLPNTKMRKIFCGKIGTYRGQNRYILFYPRGISFQTICLTNQIYIFLNDFLATFCDFMLSSSPCKQLPYYLAKCCYRISQGNTVLVICLKSQKSAIFIFMGGWGVVLLVLLTFLKGWWVLGCCWRPKKVNPPSIRHFL